MKSWCGAEEHGPPRNPMRRSDYLCSAHEEIERLLGNKTSKMGELGSGSHWVWSLIGARTQA